MRRVNANDRDFFVNAGGTNQKGIEITLSTSLLKQNTGFIKGIDFNNAATFNNFKFKDYVVGTNNFSGNLLSGVPKINLNSNLNFDFDKGFNLFIQYQYNGKTSLNDAETVFANEYHLVMSKINWQTKIKKSVLNLTFGVDNLLNEKYSLGNDLNAFGNRFFNAAANRNYFLGLGIKF